MTNNFIYDETYSLIYEGDSHENTRVNYKTSS